MDIEEILKKFKEGELSLEEVKTSIENKSYFDLGFAKLDISRKERQGFSEVVYGASKEKTRLLEIVKKIYEEEGEVLVTRVSKEKAEYILNSFPNARYDSLSKVLILESREKNKEGNVLFVLPELLIWQ